MSAVVPARPAYRPEKLSYAAAIRDRAAALSLLARIALMDGPAGVAAREHLARIRGERT